MKKITAILLSMTMLVSLCACSNTPTPAPSSGSETKAAAETTETKAETEAAAAETTATEAAVYDSDKVLDNVDGYPKEGKGITQPVKVALVVKKNIEFFLNMQEGIEAELKRLNPDNELAVYSNEGDVNKEVTNVEDILLNNFDALLICCQDINGSTVSLKAAADAGLPVVVLDSGCNDMEKYVTASITSDNVEAGEIAMNVLADAMGGAGKLAIFENTLQATDAERGEGRDKALEKYPDIEIVCRQNDQGTMENSYKAFSDFLVSNPDITGIWTLGDNAAAGAIAALKDLGYEAGEVFVVGIDCTTTGAQNIREGWQLGSAKQFPNELGIAGVRRIINVLNGADASYEKILVSTKWADLSNIDEYVPAQ